MSKKKIEWVRSFEIGSPEKNEEKGHTTYKITSLLFPVGFPEAGTKLTTTKRYSEFQKLHKALLQIHKNLYLSGTFPTLPKTSYFKRFQPEVLKQRREKCLELLNFAADHSQLYNSRVFVDFFSSANDESPSANLPSDNDDDGAEEEINNDNIKKDVQELQLETDRLSPELTQSTTEEIQRLADKGNIC